MNSQTEAGNGNFYIRRKYRVKHNILGKEDRKVKKEKEKEEEEEVEEEEKEKENKGKKGKQKKKKQE